MSRRGLVLGGGGITGIAWETGLLLGLAEAGVDLTAADRVVGTSAGSIVGAQVTSDVPLEEWFRRQLLPPSPDGDAGVPLARIGLGVLLQYGLAILRARGDVERFGRLLGSRAIAVSAVDAATGELATFGPRGPYADVSLRDAVNASCAVPCVYPPIPIAGRTYVDGGMRSGANADLAAGCDPVVVLSPGDRTIGPLRSAVDQLSDLGVPHLVVTPDRASLKAIGKNVLDPQARPPSARAGRAQAASVVEEVRALWGASS